MSEQNKKTQEQKNNNPYAIAWFIIGGLTVGMGIIGIVAAILEEQTYKNIVVKKDGTKMLVRDVETGTERIIKSVHSWGAPVQNFEEKDWRYVPVGDTIFVQTSSKDYNQHKVLHNPIVSFQYDSVSARKERDEFNTLKQSMMNEMQR